MREYVKGYRAFVSDKWIKLLLYLAYPLCAIGICKCFKMLFSDVDGFLYQWLVAGFMIFAELLLDVPTFGGILRKDTGKLDYLKLSHRGMKILEKSLWADKIRRLITTSILLSAVYIICHEGMNPAKLISSIFATGLVLELGLMITRHFDTAGVVGLIAWLVYMVGPLLVVIATVAPAYCLVGFVIVYVIILIWSNTYIMKKAGRVYYDSESEEKL